MKMLDLFTKEDQAPPLKIELSPELKAALQLRHRKIHDGHKRDLIKAVLLCSENWGIKQIAQALRLHEVTISR
jgi:hypothetical protein